VLCGLWENSEIVQKPVTFATFFFFFHFLLLFYNYDRLAVLSVFIYFEKYPVCSAFRFHQPSDFL